MRLIIRPSTGQREPPTLLVACLNGFRKKLRCRRDGGMRSTSHTSWGTNSWHSTWVGGELLGVRGGVVEAAALKGSRQQVSVFVFLRLATLVLFIIWISGPQRLPDRASNGVREICSSTVLLCRPGTLSSGETRLALHPFIHPSIPPPKASSHLARKYSSV